MKRIFVLGSINMDIVIHTPYIPAQGETLSGNDFFLNPGGKGANQAVACAKQDIETYLIANVGNDIFGSNVKDNLNKYGVNTKYVNTLKDISTGVAVIIICNNDNRIILDSGANGKITLNQIEEALAIANENDIFITQFENNFDAVFYGLKRAKEKKMITIFNPAPMKEFDLNYLEYVDYLIVNEGECEQLSKIKINSIDDAIKSYKSLSAKNLIVTLGSKGSIFVNKDEKQTINPVKVHAIDTTAAGDTYVGVFASQLANNKDVLSALNYASKASALTCLKNGAQQSIPYKEEVDSFNK